MTNGIREIPKALQKLYQKQFLQCAGTSDYFAGCPPPDIQTVAHSRVIAHQWNTFRMVLAVLPNPYFVQTADDAISQVAALSIRCLIEEWDSSTPADDSPLTGSSPGLGIGPG